MKKMRWIIWLLILVSCTQADDQARIDSSENLLTSPSNKVQVFTLDVPWSCEKVDDKLTHNDLYMSELDMLLMMKDAECKNVQTNLNSPHAIYITVITHAPNHAVSNANLLSFVPLVFSDSTMDKACKKFVELCGQKKEQSQEKIILESAIGNYSIKEYIEKVKFTTPLIVLLPMKVKGNKLTPALYQAAFSRI